MVTIYGKDNCTACNQTKMALEYRGISYEYKMLDKDYTMEDLMDKLEETGLAGFRTFPLIVQDGKGFTFTTLKDIKGE